MRDKLDNLNNLYATSLRIRTRKRKEERRIESKRRKGETEKEIAREREGREKEENSAGQLNNRWSFSPRKEHYSSRADLCIITLRTRA